jgi:hypothetical protein
MESLLRWKLGWIEPAYDITFSAAGQESAIVLEDVTENGDDGFAVIRTADSLQYFLLECRDSTSTAFTDGSAFGDSSGCLPSKGRSGMLLFHIQSEMKRGSAAETSVS